MHSLPGRLVRAVVASTLFVSAGTGLAFVPVTAAHAVSPAACAAYVPALVNGGFETPVIANYSLQPSNNSASPAPGIGWDTTDPTKVVELWHTGFNGVPSDTGGQFAELNANNVGTLSQDLATTPGFVLLWSIAHRGRSGTDVMTVSIGAPGGALAVQTPTGAGSPDISDGTGAWGHYRGVYTVPAGQTTTRFAFNSISSVGGASFGNFLDSVVFTVAGSACDDAVTALTGQTTALNVLANDLGNGLSVTGVTVPAHGTATIVANKVNYTPTAGYFGTDTFDYTIVDSFGVTDTGTVVVTIPVLPTAGPLTSTGVGTAPQTATATVPAGGSAALLDGSGNPVTSRTIAGQGTYVINSGTGVITFTPVLGYAATGSVPYRVTDTYGQTAQSTYQPTVTAPAPPAPPAKTSTGVGTAQQSVTLTIPAGGAVRLLNASNNPVLTRTVAGEGTYTLDATTGVVTFDPVLGFTGTATPVPYRATDAYGQTGSSTYTPTVTTPAPPAPPAKTSTGVGTAQQSVTLAIPPSGSVTLLNASNNPVLTRTVAGQGTYTLNAATGVVTFDPILGFTGTATPVPYRATDAYGQTGASTYTPTVTPPAPPAPPAKTSTGVGTAQQSVTLAIPPSGSVTLLNASNNPVLTRTVAGQGTYTLNAATGVVTFDPVFGYAGTATAVPYRVTDAYGQTGASTYTPTVTPPAPPAPPAKTSTGVGTAQQSVTLAIPPSGSVTLLNASNNPVLTRTVAGQGTYTLNAATGVVTFDPVFGYAGTATAVPYRVTDAYGQTGSSTYTPTVTPPAPPVPAAMTSTGAGTAPQQVTLTIPPSGSVTLLDTLGNPVTVRTVAGQGTYTLVPATGVVTFAPVLGFVGPATPVLYQVTDAYGQTGQSTYTPTVTLPAPPAPPARTSTGVGTAQQSAILPIPPSGSVALIDTSGNPVASRTVAGEGVYNLDAATGSVTFDPVLGFAGSATPVPYRVTDAYGQTGQSTYTPSVTLPAPPPAVPLTSSGVGIAVQSATTAIPPSGSVTLLDAGAAPVTSVTIAGEGTYTINASTGVVQFAPMLGFAGTATSAVYRVTNAYGQTAQSTYTATVSTPAGPTATPLSSTGIGTAHQSVAVALPAGSSVTLFDGAGNAVTTLAVAGQGSYAVDSATGTFSFAPLLGFTGVATPAAYRVTDAYGQNDASTYTPTVTAPAPPVAPALTSSGAALMQQSVTLSIPVSGVVTMLDGSGNAVTALTVDGEGVYALDAVAGVITFQPVLGFAGQARPVSYRVTDAYGQSAQSTYTPTVALPAPPQPPVRKSIGLGAVRQTVTVVVPANGYITLVDPLGASVQTLVVPLQGRFDVDPHTGVISFTPLPGFHGTVLGVRYRMYDAYGQSGTATYTPTVLVAPVVLGDTTTAGAPTQGAPQVSAAGAPAGVVTTVTGVFLPFTGGPVVGLLRVGLLLVVSGFVLLVATRRRKSSA